MALLDSIRLAGVGTSLVSAYVPNTKLLPQLYLYFTTEGIIIFVLGASGTYYTLPFHEIAANMTVE